MKKHLNEMQEYDKRMGLPDFNWTPEMETEHYKKTQTDQCIIDVVIGSSLVLNNHKL